MKSLKALLLALCLSLAAAGALAAPVDVNTADAKTLATAMVGVGQKTAEAIVAYRSKNGPFKTVDDLTKVKGIGPKTVDKNRANITVGAAKPASNPK